MALLEQWHAKAYNEKENKGVLQKLWQDYFAKEKGLLHCRWILYQLSHREALTNDY